MPVKISSEKHSASKPEKPVPAVGSSSLHRRAAQSWLLIILLVLGAIFRIVGYAPNSKPITSSDTGVFATMTGMSVFSREFWLAQRPPAVSLTYKITGFDADAIMWLHLTVAILSWSALAVAVHLSLLPRKLLALVAAFMVLAIGYSGPVVQWDRVILSESLALSGFALVVAALIVMGPRLLQPPQGGVARAWELVRLAAVAGVISYWMFIRDTNAYPVTVLLAVLGFGLIAAQVGRRGNRLALATIFSGLVVVFAVQQILHRKSDRWVFPLYNNITNRVLPSKSAVDYFTERGMPAGPEVMRFAGGYASSQDYAIYNLERLSTWVRTRGIAEYQRFLLTHPRYAFGQLWSNMDQVLALPMDWLYRPNLEYRPKWFDEISKRLHPGSRGFILAGFAAIVLQFAASAYLRDGRRLSLAVVVGWVFAGSAVLFWVSFHGDAMEIERHIVGGYIGLNLATWLGLLYAVDAVSVALKQYVVPNENVVSQRMDRPRRKQVAGRGGKVSGKA